MSAMAMVCLKAVIVLDDEDEINPLDKETYKERYEKYNNEVHKPYLIIDNENNEN